MQYKSKQVNTLMSGQNGRLLADDIFMCIFLIQKFRISNHKSSLFFRALNQHLIYKSRKAINWTNAEHALKRKCRHFDEILIIGCTGSCHFDNFQCSQWWKFHQNEDISVSVRPMPRRHHVARFEEAMVDIIILTAYFRPWYRLS